MDHRRLARECAVQMLFQIEISGQRPDEVFGPYWQNRPMDQSVRTMAERLVQGASAHAEECDGMIRDASRNWRLERMPVVDRNVLRLAIYEFLHESSTPRIVVIDEAVDLAKRYGGGEESGQFVNGVLDAIRARLEGPGGGDRSAAAGTRR